MLPQIIIYINVLRKSWSIKTHLLSYKSLALLFLEVSSLHFFFILNRKLNMHSSKLEVAGQKCLSLVKDSGAILNTVNKVQMVTCHVYIYSPIWDSQLCQLSYLLNTFHFMSQAKERTLWFWCIKHKSLFSEKMLKHL